MPNGEPSVITWRTSSGVRWASRRAKIPPRLWPTMLTGVPCSSRSRAHQPRELVDDLLRGPAVAAQRPPDHRVPEGAHPPAQRPGGRRRRPCSPGRTSTGCRSPRGAAAQQREGRGEGAGARHGAHRLGGGQDGPAPAVVRHGRSCGGGRRGISRAGAARGHEDLVDRPWPDVLAARAGHPGVTCPPAAPVERVPPHLGVAGPVVAVVLAEGVPAAADRRQRRGRRRGPPPEPPGTEAGAEQSGTHQQADRVEHALPPPVRSLPRTVTRIGVQGGRSRGARDADRDRPDSARSGGSPPLGEGTGKRWSTPWASRAPTPGDRRRGSTRIARGTPWRRSARPRSSTARSSWPSAARSSRCGDGRSGTGSPPVAAPARSACA